MISSIKRILRPLYVPAVNGWRRLCLRIKYPLHIMNSRRTIKYVIKNRCSVARFGDGEFALMLDQKSIGFQTDSREIAMRLRGVLEEENSNLLLCIPRCLVTVSGLKKPFPANYWATWCILDDHYEKIALFLHNTKGKSQRYGDAMMTRPYMDWMRRSHAEGIFPLLRKIWEGRELLIAEGEQTRLGVGNDLFAGAKSIKRILTPACNAFSVYEKILNTIKKEYKDELILLAVGPTATVLAADLSKMGMQAIDIGHIDIEYMWYLMGAKEKIAIPGKYTNEVHEGHVYTECYDKEYQQQIIARIDL